jgi:hypothetical protein
MLMDFKYLEIEPITKMTQIDRLMAGMKEELCLSPEEISSLRKGTKFVPNDASHHFNIGMILMMVASLE